MKIEYSTGGAYTAFLDEGAGDVLTEDSADYTVSAIVQQEPLSEGDSQARFGRANKVAELPLGWVRTFSSAADAVAERRTNGALAGTKLTLRITEGAEMQYLHNAVSDSYRARLVGATLIQAYAFKGDALAAI